MAVDGREDLRETDTGTHFELPFVMKPNKTSDPQKLKDGGYNIAIVCSSSINGASFEGEPGSTLYIDELEIIY